ncbi:VOC family protein [Solirhodobacter olei]|uniref:VOC family protein n=1 Tax=Solirhodobacter olei TaxID=2493082 RepID=UPI000FD7C694|nr:VOC family protein [Solirhodobacter olei]
MQPEAILETCLYADDLAAAESFYREVFGLERVTRSEGRHVFFRCGSGMLLIFNPAATSAAEPPSPIPRHGAAGPGHVCFRVAPQAFPDWYERFQARGVPIEAVHTWPGGARSLYVRDPAGNSVEIGEARMWGLS